MVRKTLATVLRRDTSEWDKGRLQNYQEQNLVNDSAAATCGR